MSIEKDIAAWLKGRGVVTTKTEQSGDTIVTWKHKGRTANERALLKELDADYDLAIEKTTCLLLQGMAILKSMSKDEKTKKTNWIGPLVVNNDKYFEPKEPT